MKLFINEGICEWKRKGNVKIKELPNSKLKLSIPNYVEKEAKQEDISFIFSGITERYFEKDCLLKNITLRKTSKNRYYVEDNPSEKEERYIYALIRGLGSCIPDDVPTCMKDKVKVLRRLRFSDHEIDYGDFLSNIYLIKIKLNISESLPVYFTDSTPFSLTEHYVFYRAPWDKEYHVSEKLETYILLNERNIGEFISLSSLCE